MSRPEDTSDSADDGGTDDGDPTPHGPGAPDTAACTRDPDSPEETSALATMVEVARSAAMRRALLAFMLFGVAEMATWVGLLIWAFEVGGATASGIIAVAQLVPSTIVAPLGSAMADRLPRARALKIGYLSQAATNLATAGVLFAGAPFWVVCTVSAAAACAMTLSRPAHYAALPEIARTPDELTAGNTASSTVEGAADFAGPALAGGMLLVTSIGTVFVLMALAGVVSALAVTRLPIRPVETPDEDDADESYWADVHEGIMVVIRDPAANVLTTLVGGQFVVVGLLEILAVVIALDLLSTGAAGPGLLASALGIGAIAGAGASVTLIGRRRMTPAIAFAVAATSLPIAVIVLTDSFVAAMILFGLAGAGKAYFDVAARTLLQRTVTPRVLARVFGVQEALLMAGSAIGAAIVPVFVVAFGVHGAVLATALVLPVVGLVTWPRIRRLERDALVPGPELELLRRVPMFAVLRPGQLEQLAAAARPLEVPAGSRVVIEGDRGTHYYVIQSGTATVSQASRVVNRLGPGDGFGEIALLRDVPRTATVTADVELTMLTIQRDAFLFAVTGSRRSLAEAERTVASYPDTDPRQTGTT